MESIQVVPIEPLGKSPVTEFSQFGNGPVLALTADHKLYHLNGETWSGISTPNTMRVVGAAFRSQNEGMVIGTTTNNPGSGGGSFIMGWAILGFLIAIIVGLIYAIVRLIRHRRWKLLSAAGVGIIAVIVLFLHFVKFNNQTTRTFSFDAGTHYLGETGQPGNQVALTADGGMHWRSFSLGTNFYLTACAPVDSAYLVTTYASPDHLDGDLWRVPLDSIAKPGLFDAARALWGIAKSDSTVFAYGTDISVAHIGNPWRSVRGEVLRTDDRLDSLTILNISSNGGIVSLSAIKNGAEFWAVTRDHHLKWYSKERITGSVCTGQSSNEDCCGFSK
jgi:hypothetical protein